MMLTSVSSAQRCASCLSTVIRIEVHACGSLGSGAVAVVAPLRAFPHPFLRFKRLDPGPWLQSGDAKYVPEAAPLWVAPLCLHVTVTLWSYPGACVCSLYVHMLPVPEE